MFFVAIMRSSGYILLKFGTLFRENWDYFLSESVSRLLFLIILADCLRFLHFFVKHAQKMSPSGPKMAAKVAKLAKLSQSLVPERPPI